jgi:hypothetical protein
MSILFGLLLSAVAVGATPVTRDVDTRVLADGASSAKGCVDVSYTYPRWTISNLVFTIVDYNTGGRNGDVTFSAHNAANNLSTDCFARDIDLNGATGKWHNCTAPETSFQFSLESYDLRMKGSWDCGSGADFAGGGIMISPEIVRCDDYPYGVRGWETACIMRDTYVATALSYPISIRSQQPRVPEIPEARASSCVERSANPSWKIEGFAYQQRASFAELSVNITNLSDDVRISCSAKTEPSKTQLTKHSAQWLSCSDPASPDTKVTFDPGYNVLGINQTWKCPDASPRWDPASFSGVGYLVQKPQCTGVSSDNSLVCSLPTTTFNGYTDNPAIPHTSYNNSCTLNSIHATTLVLKAYEIGTVASQKHANFTLFNPGSGDDYQLSRIPIQEDGAWHDCAAADSDALPWQLVGCHYNLGKDHDKIAFKIEWYCDDRDPSHAILFKAEASSNLPATSARTDLSISSLTWNAIAGPMDRGPLLPWV